MKPVIARLALWMACVAGVAALGFCYVYPHLYARRYPYRTAAKAYVQGRLGALTPRQEQQVQAAVQCDALGAMLVVRAAQADNKTPWESLADLCSKGLPTRLMPGKLALEKSLHDQIDPEAAAAFVDAANDVVDLAATVGSQEQEDLLTQIQHLSPEEYRNVGNDSSYLLIAPKLSSQYRGYFRDNQDILTPVLAAADPKEWDRLMKLFAQTSSTTRGLLKDPQLGQTYALVYMVHSDLVEDLKRQGIPQKEAIEFVGANASTITDVKAQPWTAWIRQMRQHFGPDGKTSLFDCACRDPAVFWLMAQDPSSDKAGSLKILGQYAGTDLPAILLKYRNPPGALQAAIDALQRFDNEDDQNPDRRQAAAHCLSLYQDEDAFKALLAQHKAVLIPAICCGGKNALADFQRNPMDIFKYVDENGKPKGTPWWTNVPGGSIAYAIREKVQGRTLTWGELGWATVDAVMTISSGSLIVELGKTASGPLVRIAAKQGSQTAARIAADAGGKMVVEETLVASSKAARMLTARTILGRAGTRVVQARPVIWTTMAAMAKYPKTTLITSAVILTVLFPEKAEAITARLREFGNHAAQETGRLVAGVPGQIIQGMVEEIRSLATSSPMLAWLYYLLLAFLVFGIIILVPLLLLRLLLPPVHRYLMGRLDSWLNAGIQRISRKRRLAAESAQENVACQSRK